MKFKNLEKCDIFKNMRKKSTLVKTSSVWCLDKYKLMCHHLLTQMWV